MELGWPKILVGAAPHHLGSLDSFVDDRRFPEHVVVALEVMQQFNGRGSQGKGFLRLFVKFVYVLGHASYDLKLIEAQVNFRRVVYIL